MQTWQKVELHTIREKVKGWIELSRPPFHSVGLVPFLLGTYLAWKFEGTFNETVFILGVIGVILIMLSTYHAGEYFDYVEDRISKQFFPSRFSGGSGVIPAGTLPRAVPLWTSIITFVLAAVIGILLQFYFSTGPYTLLLGCLGAFPGFFYSTQPVRLVDKGWGEIFIGFCYGWLPVASAFYIQMGYIHPLIHWIGLPIGCTIFNVILLNEFPDYIADTTAGKKNLLVRLGKTGGVALYVSMAVLSWITILLAINAGVPIKLLYFYFPIFALSVTLTVLMVKKMYDNQKVLETLCGLNIVVNLGTSISFILAYT